MKLKEWLKGNKTYITAGIVAVLGTLQGMEVFEIPEAGWIVLGACGLGFLRAGVKDIAKTIKETK